MPANCGISIADRGGCDDRFLSKAICGTSRRQSKAPRPGPSRPAKRYHRQRQSRRGCSRRLKTRHSPTASSAMLHGFSRRASLLQDQAPVPKHRPANIRRIPTERRRAAPRIQSRKCANDLANSVCVAIERLKSRGKSPDENRKPPQGLQGLAFPGAAEGRCRRRRGSGVRPHDRGPTPSPSNSGCGQTLLLPDFASGGMPAKRFTISGSLRSPLQIPTLSASRQNRSRSIAFNGRSLAHASICLSP